MPNNPYYVFDEKLCKVEGMTKEQIINAIAQATGETPQDVDEGFISTLVENNKSRSIHFWKGTRAQFNALESHDANTFYIIDDDSTIEDLESTQAELREMVIEVGGDTGWQDITATNTSSQTVTIGQYRVIGKIAYFDFRFDPSEFDGDVFTLPIHLDQSSKGATFAFYQDSEEHGDVVGFASIMTNGTVIGFSFEEDSDLAELSFSYPVATGQ